VFTESLPNGREISKGQNAPALCPSALMVLSHTQQTLLAVEKLLRKVDPRPFSLVRRASLSAVISIEADRRLLTQDTPASTRERAVRAALKNNCPFSVCAKTAKTFRRLRDVDTGAPYQDLMTRAYSQVASASEVA
jgi:hypothetical protein